MTQLIARENFTSIQEAQAGLARVFEKAEAKKGFYRVLRNNKPLGVLIPEKVWDSFLEDLEALSSPRYLADIREARASKKSYSSDEVKRALGMI